MFDIATKGVQVLTSTLSDVLHWSLGAISIRQMMYLSPVPSSIFKTWPAFSGLIPDAPRVCQP